MRVCGSQWRAFLPTMSSDISLNVDAHQAHHRADRAPAVSLDL